MAGYRIRDKIDAHVIGTLYGFGLGLIAEWLGARYGLWPDHYGVFVVVGVPLAVGLLCRWGWELRRWYRKTRPDYDPLASLRPKP